MTLTLMASAWGAGLVTAVQMVIASDHPQQPADLQAATAEYWQGARGIPASVMCNIPARGTLSQASETHLSQALETHLSPCALAASAPPAWPPPPALSSRIGNPLLSACARAAPRLKGCNDADVGGGGGEEGGVEGWWGSGVTAEALWRARARVGLVRRGGVFVCVRTRGLFWGVALGWWARGRSPPGHSPRPLD